MFPIADCLGLNEADVLLFAVHWNRVDDVLRQVGNLSGKVVVTCSLPMNDDNTALAVGCTSSGAEKLAKKAQRRASRLGIRHRAERGALRCVRGPRTHASEHALLRGRRRREVGTPGLIRDVGFEPLDAGPLAMARNAEPFTLLVAQLAYEGAGGPRSRIGSSTPRNGRDAAAGCSVLRRVLEIVGDSAGDQCVASSRSTMPVQTRDAIFLASLLQADGDLLKRLGPARTDWSLGQLQRIRFDHPFSKVSKEITRQISHVNHEYPRGGDSSTINVTSVRDGIHRTGASWRMVIDVGSWDDSRAINALGQSGDPLSPHFADLYAQWAADQMFPLLYSRGRIEAAAQRRIKVTNR